jgi:hypothetical protein
MEDKIVYEVDGLTIIAGSDDPWLEAIETVIEEVKNGSSGSGIQ